jgi:hypothetical protein
MRDTGHDNKTPHTPKIETLDGYPLTVITMHMNPLFLKNRKKETEQRAEVVRQCDTTFITNSNREKMFNSEGSQAMPARPFIKGKLVKVKAKWSLYTS